MGVRVAAAVVGGKLAAAVSRGMGRGGGTALPGLVAERIDPAIASDLGRQLGAGRVLVTGTNGKTTTSRIIAQALEEAARPCLHNREGSNLMRGISSALLAAAGVNGRIRDAARMVGLFETDEATLPAVARALAPSALAFTNLFRDQLDRYGEVDTVATLWRQALATSPRDATLVLNSDDPSVAELAIDWPGAVHWFGLDDAALASTTTGAFDARWCRVCGGTFAYDLRYFAHVGHWRCTGCDRKRAEPATSAMNVGLTMDSASFSVPGLGDLAMPLTGVYNVYNALAAIAVCRVLGLPNEAIVAGLAHVTAAFGRQEVVELDGRKLRLMLCKNPAGANQVLQLLRAVTPQGGPSLNVALLLNDRFADGQDVSWVWDVDYEPLASLVTRCWAGGNRAEDMALRLKYASWPAPQAVEHDPSPLLDAIVADTARDDEVIVVPTYTAMLDLRAELAKRGAAAKFWE
jgi:lipid II isoglutaminyl synthase (glutamine-hydrolysing)